MEEKYCHITNSLNTVKVHYIKHYYDERTKNLYVKLNIKNDEEAKALTTYVNSYSEIVTGMQGFNNRNKLISEVVIDDNDNHITFNGCMLLDLKFQDYLNLDKVMDYEIEMSFIVDYRVKKLYLSGPMSICKNEATWRANFQKYEDIFTKKGYIVVNPAKNPILPTYEECLKHSLQQEMECDCIFFMPNSILSTGARLEYEIANACGLEIVLIDDDISFTNNYANNSGIKCKNNKL